jgi:SAM-dependent methyltransferase
MKTQFWKKAHAGLVHGRRVKCLAGHICEMLPTGASLLDVGCGDGIVDSLIQEARPDIKITGLDVLIRPEISIPVTKFDGTSIPFENDSFDVVMFIDVLHHTDDPLVLLAEASRVARSCLIIKDHTMDGLLSYTTLRFMDWFGNKPHGVALPYNYWKERQWRKAFEALHLETLEWRNKLGLYPHAADLVFGRGLHMITKLGVS